VVVPPLGLGTVTVAWMVQVSGAGALPLVASSGGPIGVPSTEKVRLRLAGTKMPDPPPAKVRWATAHVVALEFPLFVTKLPVTPPPQSNVPFKAFGALDGAAPAPDPPSTDTDVGISTATASNELFQRRMVTSPCLLVRSGRRRTSPPTGYISGSAAGEAALCTKGQCQPTQV